MRISDWSSDVCSSDLNDRADEPAQPLVVGRAVDMVVAALDLADIGQQLDAHIGREDDRHDPGCQQRKHHHPEDVAGIFAGARLGETDRSEEHTSELQSLMRISYAVFSLKTKKCNNE